MPHEGNVFFLGSPGRGMSADKEKTWNRDDERRFVICFLYFVFLSLFFLFDKAILFPIKRAVSWRESTVVQISLILRQLILHFPTSSGLREWAGTRTNECSGARKRSKQCGVSEWANGRASGPVLQPVSLIVLAHSVLPIHGRQCYGRQKRFLRPSDADKSTAGWSATVWIMDGCCCC